MWRMIRTLSLLGAGVAMAALARTMPPGVNPNQVAAEQIRTGQRPVPRGSEPMPHGPDVVSKSATSQAVDEFLDLAGDVPADARVVLFGRAMDSPAASAAASRRGVVTQLLTTLGATGILPREGQVFADIAATLPLLGQFTYAAVLLDVSAQRIGAADKPDKAGVRLREMQLAIVFRTIGRERDVLAHLNRLIQRYTNNEDATITPIAAGDHAGHRLSDRRQPAWAVIEWGKLDDRYVVALGRGSFERMAGVRRGVGASLAADGWFREAHRLSKGAMAQMELVMDVAQLTSHLGEAPPERVNAVVDALGAKGIERDVWTLGEQGRAWTCRRMFHRAERDEVRVYSDAAMTDADLAAIPSQARHAAVVRGVARWLIECVPPAGVAAMHFENADNIERWWAQLQKRLNIDVRAQLLDHIRDSLIVCDAPPHPLGISFALTVAIGIERPGEVRVVIDALLSEWRDSLDAGGANDPLDLLRVRVRKTADGIWYVQAGLLGPALAVTQRHIVVSWSPQALREVLPSFRSAASRPWEEIRP